MTTLNKRWFFINKDNGKINRFKYFKNILNSTRTLSVFEACFPFVKEEISWVLDGTMKMKSRPFKWPGEVSV